MSGEIKVAVFSNAQEISNLVQEQCYIRLDDVKVTLKTETDNMYDRSKNAYCAQIKESTKVYQLDVDNRVLQCICSQTHAADENQPLVTCILKTQSNA